MKKRLSVLMSIVLFFVFILGISLTLVPKKANAIPAFAQKYHFSCAVCHTVFPNLNPFGRAFWRNGFRLPNTNGTPADATQITQGLSLPNPWPIPIMLEPIIGYQHYTNENVSQATDAFSASVDVVDAGAFKLYTPFANSLSFYVHYGFTGKGLISGKQIFASINGLGSGFGMPSHLFNLKLGLVTTASPYFYRQMPFYLIEGPVGNGQGLAVGFDGEKGSLIHARNPGIALYGTPGYHLWYKVTVTNDAGANTYNIVGNNASNAMQYSYQLKEYYPVSIGQIEFGYYGTIIGEPMSQPIGTGGTEHYTNRVTVNGLDADLANDIYELGLTYMVQSDSKPYGPGGIPYDSTTQTSNGYNTFEIYARYLFPQVGYGLMLSADYAQYSWTHANAQEAFNGYYGTTCANAGLYEYMPYTSSNGCLNKGIKDALSLQAEYNLAYNAHLYFGYVLTNESEDNTFGTGLDFAF